VTKTTKTTKTKTRKTGIEWTEATWNPVAGCTKVSDGCKNCYAMTSAMRIAAAADARGGGQTERQRAYQRVVKRRGGSVDDPETGTPLPQWNNRVVCIESALTEPLGWRAPRVVFVNSTSDLFHPDVPFDFIDRVFAVMALTPRHTYQILTKRPERMGEYLSREDTIDCIDQQIRGLELNGMCGVTLTGEYDPAGWPLPNVWLGTSCEDQAAADARIPHLLRCPAAVRFLSCEPLLGGIELEWVFDPSGSACCGGDETCYGNGRCPLSLWPRDEHGSYAGVDWVIVGGESHKSPEKARACDVGWIRSIVGQCRDAGVACFVKQLGVRPVEPLSSFDPEELGSIQMRLRSKKGGDPAEWPEDLRVREMPGAVGG